MNLRKVEDFADRPAFLPSFNVQLQSILEQSCASMDVVPRRELRLWPSSVGSSESCMVC